MPKDNMTKMSMNESLITLLKRTKENCEMPTLLMMRAKFMKTDIYNIPKDEVK